MRFTRRLLVVLAACCVAAWTSQNLRAENWGHWRGPFYNGSTIETNLPTVWSTNENIAWTAALPGNSGSSPIVWGDRVFISCPDAEKNLVLVCLNRADGKILWQKTVGEGDRDNRMNNMSAASPVTDGKNVFVIFGTGTLAGYDFAGNLLWSRNLAKEYGRFSDMWNYGSSPLLFDGHLFVQVLQRNPPAADYSAASDGFTNHESYLLCLDPKTGTNIWRHVRPTKARGESQEAYSSPIPEMWGDKEPRILMVGGDVLTSHDARTGEELWRAGGLNSRDDSSWRIVPSPVKAGPYVVACAPKREPVFVFHDIANKMAMAQEPAVTFKDFPSDCATPLYYENKLFILDGDKQMITCADLINNSPQMTNHVQWQGSLGIREIFRASPTGADGKIYCISEKGTVVILSAGNEFKILATIPMNGERVRSSIVATGGQLIIRTGKALYCVGKK